MNNQSIPKLICPDKAPIILLRKLAMIKQHENWQRPIVFKRDTKEEVFKIYAVIRGKLSYTYWCLFPDTMEID